MEIDKRNRTELKAYFVKNAIPTESNFAEQIDAMLNQKDDGIVKLPGDPLSIEASGDATSQKKAINFYDSFTETNPAWVLSLNPRSDPADPATARAGFNISDGEGRSRLFIDRASGNVGVGTISPGRKLEVLGSASVAEDLDVGSNLTVAGRKIADDRAALDAHLAIIAGNPHGLTLGTFGVTANATALNKVPNIDTTLSNHVAHPNPHGLTLGTFGVTANAAALNKVPNIDTTLSNHLVQSNPHGLTLGTFGVTANATALNKIPSIDTTLSNHVAHPNPHSGVLPLTGGTVGNLTVSGKLGCGVSPSFALHVVENVEGWAAIFTNKETGGPSDPPLVGICHRGGYGICLNQEGAPTNTYALWVVGLGGQTFFRVNNDGTSELRQEGWRTPGFASGWGNYGQGFDDAGYFKDSMGIVHLRGLVSNGAIFQPIFVLPGGYRPPTREVFAVLTFPDAVGRVDVLPDGIVFAHTGNSAWISLDGLTFRAA